MAELSIIFAGIKSPFWLVSTPSTNGAVDASRIGNRAVPSIHLNFTDETVAFAGAKY